MQLGICCSPLHHQLAVRIANRLERNLGVTTVIVADENAPLMENWEQASASDAVLLMLDSKSAPGPVKREDWQSFLEHNGTPPTAILKLEACFYPKLLERGRFFATGGDELQAERWVERWLVNLASARSGTEIQRILSASLSSKSSPTGWWTTAVDIPGVLTLDAGDLDAVQDFVSEAGSHFQGVVWLGCEGLPTEVLKAEIEFRCASATDDQRLLFVLVHTEPDFALPVEHPVNPRHSFVIVKGRPEFLAPADPELEDSSKSIEPWIGAGRPSGFPGALLELMLGHERQSEWERLVIPLTADRRWFRSPAAITPHHDVSERHLQTLQSLFGGWRRRPELCRELVSEAAWAIHCDPLASRELCLDLARFLLAERRMDEAIAWLKMLAAAPGEQDPFALEARDELRWLVDESGAHRRPQPLLSGEQVTFDFPGFFAEQDPSRDEDRFLLEELEMELAEHLRQSAAGSASRPPGRPLQFDLFS